MKRWLGWFLLVICRVSVFAEGEASLSGHAAKLYRQAQTTGRFFNQITDLKTEVHSTSDGKSFYVVWRSVEVPRHWIVSLHGAGFPAKGFATDDLAIWHPHLKDREIGVICLQWWMGTGSNMGDFYSPEEICREIKNALKSLRISKEPIMLHGFSRGSANLYSVVGIDAFQGEPTFSLVVASSGGVSLDYPPNQALLHGDYGIHPLKNTRWITVAGARDPQPERDGVPGMRRTAAWLKEQGAVVLDSIEDPQYGHGALHRNPAHIRRVLDLFLQ